MYLSINLLYRQNTVYCYVFRLKKKKKNVCPASLANMFQKKTPWAIMSKLLWSMFLADPKRILNSILNKRKKIVFF